MEYSFNACAFENEDGKQVDAFDKGMKDLETKTPF